MVTLTIMLLGLLLCLGGYTYRELQFARKCNTQQRQDTVHTLSRLCQLQVDARELQSAFDCELWLRRNLANVSATSYRINEQDIASIVHALQLPET